MSNNDYRAVLDALDRALAVYENSTGFIDRVHREICDNLRGARLRVLQLIEANV